MKRACKTNNELKILQKGSKNRTRKIGTKGAKISSPSRSDPYDLDPEPLNLSSSNSSSESSSNSVIRVSPAQETLRSTSRRVTRGTTPPPVQEEISRRLLSGSSLYRDNDTLTKLRSLIPPGVHPSGNPLPDSFRALALRCTNGAAEQVTPEANYRPGFQGGLQRLVPLYQPTQKLHGTRLTRSRAAVQPIEAFTEGFSSNACARRPSGTRRTRHLQPILLSQNYKWPANLSPPG
jgi:hypothetical protein